MNFGKSPAKMLNKSKAAPAIGDRDNAYGCGEIKKFKPAELEEMGYEEFRTDIHLDYKFTPRQEEVVVTAHLRDSGMFEISLESSFNIKG